MANKQITDFVTLTSALTTTELLVQDSGTLLTSKMLVVREGYEDLKPTGSFTPGGGSSPSVASSIGIHERYEFSGSANNRASFVFHLDHDYVEGTDIFFHVHHAPTAVTPTGTVIWRVHYQYARGYGLDAYTGTDLTQDFTATVTGAAQYEHVITEGAAINDATVGSAIQTDGLILATVERLGSTDTNTAAEVFLEFDIHYKSDGRKTVDKNDTGSGWVKV
jgi:hypothetical protein